MSLDKVVLFTSDLGGLGGTTSALNEMARGFNGRGLSVSYMTLGREVGQLPVPGEVFRVFPGQAYTTDNPLVKRFPGPGGIKLKAMSLYTPAWRKYCLKRLDRHLAKIGPDTAIIALKYNTQKCLTEAIGRGVWAANGSKRPLLVYQNHASMQWMRHFPDYPQVAAPADVFTCLADPYTRETAQILGRQVVTMPNSIRSFELPTAPKTNKIVVLSRLDEAKHLDRLIQAFAQVQGQVKESWQLVIYGEGPSRESLEALVADLHLSDRVSLPGSCYDLTKAFSGASLSALVSGNEGQGLNVVEAAMAGVPSVVTPCSPGAIELAEHGGYLAGGFEVDDIAQALRQAMCDDEREAVGLRAQTYAQRFSTAAVTDNWLELFARLA